MSGGSSWTRTEAVRWVLLSAGSFAANLGLTILFTEVVGLPPPTSVGIALALVMVANFFLVRHVVFDIGDVPVVRQAARFGGLTMVFRAGEWVVFALAHLAEVADYRALLALVLLTSSVVKFVVYRRLLAG